VNKDWPEFNPSPFRARYFSVPELNKLLQDNGFKTEFYGAGGMGAGERTRDDLPIPVKVEFDEYYLKNMSFFFDFKTRLP